MKIAITGIGLVTSLGQGVEKNWQDLCAGKSGIKPIKRFGVEYLKTTIGATIDQFDSEHEYISAPERTYMAGKLALSEAIEMAGAAGELEAAQMYFGTPTPEADWGLKAELHNAALAQNASPTLADYESLDHPQTHQYLVEEDTAYNGARLADDFNIEGPVVTLTTACASGGSAIQLAVDAIRRGECEIAVVVGADAGITQENLTRFSLLSALSTKNEQKGAASRPFDKTRDGFVMGEGSGAIILESEDHARRRRARPIGFVLGCGSTTDNYHKTRSNPSGEFIAGCMAKAISDAGIAPEEIGYINAHGTSTPENDKMEAIGINLVFGEHAQDIKVSSTKSMIGHTLCAAGAIETIISLLTISRNQVPPNINLQEQDPAIKLNIIRNSGTVASCKTAMSNSFGFGGQNVSVVVGIEGIDYGK